MSEFGYKVIYEASCGAKRFAAYHDEEFLEFHAAGEEGKDRLSSQSCARCHEHHTDDEYHTIDVQRSEIGQDEYHDAYPTRVDEWANPEAFY